MTHHATRLFMIAAAFGLTATAAQAQTVLTLSDGVIENSLCVGGDCGTGIAFGSDTIRLRENNLRIHFDDTSSTGSFPNQDWRIEVNAQANGGGEYFRVIDATASRNIFTLEANAPSNSLVVDDGGRIGNGTATPVTEIHSSNGDTPALRLEQNGSSGFAPQIWDVAGNETSFFIRDASNGSTLPFRIRPGAPSQSLVIDTDGSVGVGTLTSDGKLHTAGSGTQLIYFESTNNDAVQVRMRTDSQNRRFLATNGADEVKSQIVFNDNNIQLAGATSTGANLWAIIDANGITTLGPDCTTPCDAVFDPSEFQVPSIEEHAEYMWENMHLAAVGPTGPDQPFNLTAKTAGMLHELEVAHVYIEQLNSQMKMMQAAHAEQIGALTERLSVLEVQ